MTGETKPSIVKTVADVTLRLARTAAILVLRNFAQTTRKSVMADTAEITISIQ